MLPSAQWDNIHSNEHVPVEFLCLDTFPVVAHFSVSCRFRIFSTPCLVSAWCRSDVVLVTRSGCVVSGNRLEYLNLGQLLDIQQIRVTRQLRYFTHHPFSCGDWLLSMWVSYVMLCRAVMYFASLKSEPKSVSSGEWFSLKIYGANVLFIFCLCSGVVLVVFVVAPVVVVEAISIQVIAKPPSLA